ncbi:hypothetical protein VCE7224_00272 [Vibrio celticus]|uniref:Uncharacterized protein n=1 Tax=Vibrio celticus TaxID=446372 RepID=A0A1C3J921_9VIBR|nr:hypothetical protein VCE7224_00272 [Vibrio celticus]
MRKMTLLFLISYKTSHNERLCDIASVVKIQQAIIHLKS